MKLELMHFILISHSSYKSSCILNHFYSIIMILVLTELNFIYLSLSLYFISDKIVFKLATICTAMSRINELNCIWAKISNRGSNKRCD